MGLDTVELVMAIEGEFAIAITDENAVKLVRLGDLQDHVVRTLKARGEVGDEAATWERIKAIMRRDHAIPDRHLVLGASLVEDLGLD